MAYNRENLLKRIVEIQDIVLHYKALDVPQVVIWRKYIADQYHISFSCFNQYLTIPAKTELKKIQAIKASKNKQEPTLF